MSWEDEDVLPPSFSFNVTDYGDTSASVQAGIEATYPGIISGVVTQELKAAIKVTIVFEEGVSKEAEIIKLVLNNHHLWAVRTTQISVLEQSYEAALNAGFDASVTGASYHYTTAQLEDQLNFVGAGVAGMNLGASVVYSVKNVVTLKPERVLHTPAQLGALFGAALTFKETQITKREGLIAAVEASDSVEDIPKIVWT